MTTTATLHQQANTFSHEGNHGNRRVGDEDDIFDRSKHLSIRTRSGYESVANRIKHSTILNYDSMVELTRKVLTLELHRG